MPVIPSTKLARTRSISDTLAPLAELAAHSANITVGPTASFQSGGKTYEIPSYLFIGPRGGGEPIRVAIFAGIHGDEPEGTFALVRFFKFLESRPELATGYALFAYPICNPTGFEDQTRHSRNGKDLNREFWKDSSEPEVKALEAEIIKHSFHGMISLHTDDTSDGFYGFVGGATLTESLIKPAIAAAEQFVPRNDNEVIDGFQASGGIIKDCYKNVLGAPASVSPQPFEIILESPQAAPEYLKELAYIAALQSILAEYQKFIAYAANL